MTDEQIGDIYALAREAFSGGQRSFQVQAFPFRMTPLNMARHRNSPHVPFWKMLKQGYDHFEVTRLEPKVDVCDKRYVFDAESAAPFSAAEGCPAYRVREDVAAAVRHKQRRDDIVTAELIGRGTPSAQVSNGVDGGMHSIFLAAVKSHGGPGATIRTAAGTVPAYVKPPADLAQAAAGGVAPPPELPGSAQVAASANPAGISSSPLANLPGSNSERRTPAAPAASPAHASAPKAKLATPNPARPAAPAAGAVQPKSKQKLADPKTATALAPKPGAPANRQASAESKRNGENTRTSRAGLPSVPSGIVEQRSGPGR
jgi:hypothetical protein